MNTKKWIIALAMIPLFLGCSSINRQQMGTAGGALLGGLLGGLIAKNNNTAGVLIGAAIGGVAGNIIGKKMDQQAEEIKQAIPGAQVERVGEGLDITFDSDLLFLKGSAKLSDSATNELTTLASIFAKYPDTELLIEGHTSADPKLASAANAKANMELSRQRSLAVGNLLKQQGVATDRVIEKWYGGERPKFSNDTEEERRKNRRVEIAVIANEKMRKEAAEGTLQ